MAAAWPPSATTRISLKGQTVIVYGSVDDVRDALSAATAAQAARFQPVQFEGESKPAVIAVHMDDVLMLGDANGDADGSGSTVSIEGP
jgi:hypothetical protein